MAVLIWQNIIRLKCEFILNLDESLVIFLTVLDIFDYESVNSIFRNTKKAELKWLTEN